MMIWLKKVEHCKLKKIIIFLKVSMKKKKTIIQFDDTEIQKQKFYQHKRPISIKMWILVK